MTGAHWLLLAVFAGFAVLVVLLRWRWPRVWPQITEVACEHMAMAVTATEARKKEWRCSHGCVMTEGYVAYARDVDQALDIATEVDEAKARHTDQAMRRLIGDSPISEDRKSGLLGEWHERLVPWPHETTEEAADCPVCSPSGLPRRIEGGDER